MINFVFLYHKTLNMEINSPADKVKPILEKIKEERELQGYRQKELAAYLDIDTRTYSNIENGKSPLSIKQLVEISQFLKRELSHFIGSGTQYHFEHSHHPSVINDSNIQNYYGDEALKAYKLLSDNLQKEVERLKEEINLLKG